MDALAELLVEAKQIAVNNTEGLPEQIYLSAIRIIVPRPGERYGITVECEHRYWTRYVDANTSAAMLAESREFAAEKLTSWVRKALQERALSLDELPYLPDNDGEGGNRYVPRAGDNAWFTYDLQEGHTQSYAYRAYPQEMPDSAHGAQ